MYPIRNLIPLVACFWVVAGCVGDVESNVQGNFPPSSVEVSVIDAGSVSENEIAASLAFEFQLSEASSNDIDIVYQTRDGSAESGNDYISRSGTATISAGQLTTSIDIAIIDDSLDEPDEAFFVDISSVSEGSVAVGSGTGDIRDDDSAPLVSIADGSLQEGNAGQSTLSLPLSLSAPSGFIVSVDFSTANGTATADFDYVAATGQVSFPVGSTDAEINIDVISDVVDENDETFLVTLVGVANAAISTGMATGTIVDDDDPAPDVITTSISAANTVSEDSGGASLLFPVSISMASSVDITVQYQTADGTALSGSDFVAQVASVVVPAGQLNAIISVAVIDDMLDEPLESMGINLVSVSTGAIGTGSASGSISDNDLPPTVSIADATIIEGGAGQSNLLFPITLSAPSGFDISVDYATSDISAMAGSDYSSVSGTAVISAGAVATSVSVPVSGDATFEPDESFGVAISAPVNVSIGDDSAVGVISNDDSEPSISVADEFLGESDAGQTNMVFTVTLSSLSSADVTFAYASSDNSATAGEDYTAVSSTGTITAGNLSATINVPITGDTVSEPDETFTLSLSNPANATIADGSAVGTINDDDSSSQSGLSSRPSNLTCLATDAPTFNSSIATQVAFPDLPSLTRPVGLLRAPGDSSQWYVIEKAGRIFRFDNSPSVSSVSDFIDIQSPGDPIDVKSGHLESGLLGMAFHPDYGNGNWFVYLYYMIDGGSAGADYFSIVSRFESKDNGLTLDATDAVELLRLDQPYTNHNGGHMAFGPDGYLYIAVGDGGAGGDPADRSQNTSNLFGTVLRIDVDSGSPYGIPGDNPFRGNALCNDGVGSVACPEIYAWGLRNPWKFSFDDATGNLWLGDVGQNSREEVNIVELGGNYGWRCREGSQSFNGSGFCPAGLIDPIIEYPHSVGNSITGGVVYRGSGISELSGRYVFADYAQGKIFAGTNDGNGGYGYEQLLDTSHFIAAFAQEPNGELLYLNYISGDILRIVQSGGNSNDPVPNQLSATGCVNASNPALPAVGQIPYDVNALFWSDGASKERWYAIPDGTTIDISADGDWQFPVGTVLTKNFRINNTLVETRLFMRHTNGEWGGYTYEWNGAGTDAARVVGGKQATKSGQEWIYPSSAECLQCHTAAAGFSLGIEHGQLNKDFTYPSTGLTGNQLYTADFVNLLTDPLGDIPANLPNFADPADTSESLGARARAYLHTNCAGCHRPGGPTPSNMDLRHATLLEDTNTCDEMPTSGDLGIPGARLVDPGSPATSLVIERASLRDSHGMPPLGSNLVDTQGVQLLINWVNSLSACP